jgi:hypothetical protein
MSKLFKYSIDKRKSLEIIEGIFGHLKNPSDTIHHWNLEIGSPYNSKSNVVAERHKLAIVEIERDDYIPESATLSDYYDQLINFDGIGEQVFYDIRSDWVEINGGSTEDDCILLDGYFGTASLGSDAASVLFTYDNTLKCWVKEEGTNENPAKMDCNGQITILDFSEYLTDN